MEQRVLDIEVRAVRELENFKPELYHCHEGRNRAENHRKNVGGLFELFHIGRLRGRDLREVALTQMMQIEHHHPRHHEEGRYPHRELRHQLFEKDSRVAHLLEPHEVRDETDQAQK